MPDIIAKNISTPDRTWTFLDGSTRSVVILDSVAIGRGEYRPGWRWSEHVGPLSGKPAEAHIGSILSGRMGLKSPDGQEVTVGPGDAFELKPDCDAWVIGDEPCIALDVVKSISPSSER